MKEYVHTGVRTCFVFMFVYVHACMCVCAYVNEVCACLRACVRACVRVRVCVCL